MMCKKTGRSIQNKIDKSSKGTSFVVYDVNICITTTVLGVGKSSSLYRCGREVISMYFTNFSYHNGVTNGSNTIWYETCCNYAVFLTNIQH